MNFIQRFIYESNNLPILAGCDTSGPINERDRTVLACLKRPMRVSDVAFASGFRREQARAALLKLENHHMVVSSKPSGYTVYARSA